MHGPITVWSQKVTAWPNVLKYLCGLFVSPYLRKFLQTFITVAFWDKDELITFGDQKVKVAYSALCCSTNS